MVRISRRLIVATALLLLIVATAAYAQRRFGGFGGFGQRFRGGVVEGPGVPPRFPPKNFEDGRVTICKLMYTSNRREAGGIGWSTDYPFAAINLMTRLSELTRIPISRDGSKEINYWVIRLTDDALFDCPFLIGSDVGTASFSDTEAKRLREYLLKGGFLMVDDFHGTQDWENFMNGMRQVLPDRPIEDLESGDEIFHTLYDVDDKMQIPGEQYVWTGRTYEKDGYQPKWRAIRDEKGRIMVAICHNMHLGDAWEWADDPNYPETFASMAFRVGLDYILYGMTH